MNIHGQPLESLISTRRYTPYELESKKEFIEKKLSPEEEEDNRFLVRWDLWLYFVFYIILILIGLLFIVNLNDTLFYQNLNYPDWAPSAWILMCVWGITYTISLVGLWPLMNHSLLAFFMLSLLMNLVLLIFFVVIIWFTGVLILGSILLILAILYSVFVTVMMSNYNMLAMGLQIPYILFLLMLTVISFQISHDNK